MILNTPENRRIVTEYLATVNEDDFIADVITPFLSSQGYYVYRINSHSPGEHGKDLIFYRHVPIFYDYEFIAVQAKTQALTTANVTSVFAQIIRAYGTKFPMRSGGAEAYPHYVMFINARPHANEAQEELIQLLKDYRHVKILTQETVCELILKTGIAPISLLGKLSTSSPDEISTEDKEAQAVLMRNDPKEVEDLLNHKLKLNRKYLSDKTKAMVIDFIFERWSNDPTWDGTVAPMMWLDTYFDFMSIDQYPLLIKVFEEYTAQYPSRNAAGSTYSVISKVTPQMLQPVAKEFVDFCAEMSISYVRKNREVAVDKLRQLKESGLIHETKLVTLIDAVLRVEKARVDKRNPAFKAAVDDLTTLIHPDW